jgi:transcriptional regulator with XRE-family HTH domain
MKDRVRQVMTWAKLSQQDFATYLEISPASLSSIFNGRTNPTNNHVQAIHRAFPEINVNW